MLQKLANLFVIWKDQIKVFYLWRFLEICKLQRRAASSKRIQSRLLFCFSVCVKMNKQNTLIWDMRQEKFGSK